MSIVESIAAAIERQEGMNCRNNNPGALRSWGTLPVVNGFAVFETCDAGRAALQQQVQRNIDRGVNLQEFFAGKPGVYPGYAPSSDGNQPALYAAHVSEWTGIPVDVPLNAYNGEQSTSGEIGMDGDYWLGEEPEPAAVPTWVMVAAAVTAAIVISKL